MIKDVIWGTTIENETGEMEEMKEEDVHVVANSRSHHRLNEAMIKTNKVLAVVAITEKIKTRQSILLKKKK